MTYGGHFDKEGKEKRLKELDTLTKKDDFWQNQRKSKEIIDEINYLKRMIERVEKIRIQIAENVETLKLIKEEPDEEIKGLLETESSSIKEELDSLEVALLLNGEYDSNDAIIEIHPGAGGTEACDWANMLYRMYLRYCEKTGYQVEVVDEQAGEEAGIKSVTFFVHGLNAYGYLKNEKGVHRLVRISPFDSGARRHTSFASVDVTPLFDNDKIQIELNENDLKIDVYRSSGAGGQHVNKTESAVRITHLPTKIVVTCQNERSQIQNKEKALEMLKNKLYQLDLEKKEEELKSMKGELSSINFGSQIRSYVMHPYSLVKDHRTNYEETDVEKVLDGNIEGFIEANLKRGK